MDRLSTSTLCISGNDGIWIDIENGELTGMTLIAGRDSGDIIGLSARSCSNEHMGSLMPSLKEYASTLRVVDLHNYRYIRNLHESIVDLPFLQRLILSRCDRLEKLPDSVGKLHNLVEVCMWKLFSSNLCKSSKYVYLLIVSIIFFVLSIHSFLAWSVWFVPGIRASRRYLRITKVSHLGAIILLISLWYTEIELRLTHCSLSISHSNISSTHSLKRLRIGGSSGIANKSLQRLPESFGELTSLEDLQLDKCKALKSLPASFGGLKNLTRLSLRECKALKFLPPSIVRCTNLIELNLLKCVSLKYLPPDFGSLVLLEDLNMFKCKTVKEIPHSIGCCEFLAFIDLRKCKNLSNLPDEIGTLSRLRMLHISDCTGIVEIPDLIGELPKLEVFQFENCTSLKSIPSSCYKFLDDTMKSRMLGHEFNEWSWFWIYFHIPLHMTSLFHITFFFFPFFVSSAHKSAHKQLLNLRTVQCCTVLWS